MKIIDMHLHVSFGAQELIDIANSLRIDYSEEGLLKEIKKYDIKKVIGISAPGKDSPFSKSLTPIDSKNTVPLYKRNKKILGVCSINPLKINKTVLKFVEKYIKEKIFRAFKIFPGYFYFYPQDKIYFSFYKLAEKHGIPVIIHSGITFKKNALLKYSHPIHIDEVATLFPNVKFIMAHLGNPWIQTAKAVLYKNDNVYADLSGLFEGGDYTEKEEVKKSILNVINWVGDDKLIYGSDWPIVRMGQYIKVIKSIIPKENQKKIFYNNAKKILDI